MMPSISVQDVGKIKEKSSGSTTRQNKRIRTYGFGSMEGKRN